MTLSIKPGNRKPSTVHSHLLLMLPANAWQLLNAFSLLKSLLSPFSTFLSADHFTFYSLWEQNHQKRTSTDAFTTSSPQLPSSDPYVLLSLWFPRPHSYLRSSLPALALDSVSSSLCGHSSSNSAILSLPAFSHFLPDHSHQHTGITA